MKVVVWILCFVVFTALNEALGLMVGIKLGYIPLFLICSGISTAICKATGSGEKEEKSVPSRPVASDARPDWVCASCGTANRGHIGTCQSCGVSREWSEKKQGKAKKAEPETSVIPEDKTATAGSIPLFRDYRGAASPAREDATQVTRRAVQPAVPPVIEQPATTRWICPKCGLVHSKTMSSCFHCGTQQSQANKFV